MLIHLKYIALEIKNLPEEGTDELNIDDASSLADALDALGLAEDKSYMTLVNEQSIPASQRSQRLLVDGDTLTLFSPIKGG